MEMEGRVGNHVFGGKNRTAVRKKLELWLSMLAILPCLLILDYAVSCEGQRGGWGDDTVSILLAMTSRGPGIPSTPTKAWQCML